jgi:predicted RNase H-like HicB family nuclease
MPLGQRGSATILYLPGWIENALRKHNARSGENGQWVAEGLSLPGCVSQGQTREDTVSHIREAIQLYVAVLEEDNSPVPEERFDTLLVAV